MKMTPFTLSIHCTRAGVQGTVRVTPQGDEDSLTYLVDAFAPAPGEPAIQAPPALEIKIFSSAELNAIVWVDAATDARSPLADCIGAAIIARNNR